MGVPLDSPIRDIPPCKGCLERTPGCHDKCVKYKEWRSNLDELNKRRKEYDSKPFVKYNPFDY